MSETTRQNYRVFMTITTNTGLDPWDEQEMEKAIRKAVVDTMCERMPEGCVVQGVLAEVER